MMSHIPEEGKLRTEGPERVFAELAVEHTTAGPAMEHKIAAPYRNDLLWIVSTACAQAGSLWWPRAEETDQWGRRTEHLPEYLESRSYPICWLPMRRGLRPLLWQ